MKGIQMANMGRRGAVWGAAAAVSVMFMGAASVPAEAASAPVQRLKVSCGNPELKVWYDSDQFGKYLKVWFQTAKGCPKGRRVDSLGGQIYCKSSSGPKLVYRENVTRKKAPVETLTKTLPSKSKCKSFYAEAKIAYKIGEITPVFKDTWHWNWGNYPA
ncbi:hypothetical protein GTY41_07230 [Streptomyces sp. SID685]|uniref:hypothetical protein n=1 Tax=Streptomyces TaxID=1883 RepID=UPI001370BDC5|nr:hypothetical protein [Streptomyces sp. SID685]MYR84749.1 hypothetical protein [Streptomyces sp. SID685]